VGDLGPGVELSHPSRQAPAIYQHRQPRCPIVVRPVSTAEVGIGLEHSGGASCQSGLAESGWQDQPALA
jgi:hypothetical protein